MMNETLVFLRWWFFPCLISCGCWVLKLRPNLALKYTPKIWKKQKNVSLGQVMPPAPTSMSAAFELGKLVQQLSWLRKCEEEGDRIDTTSVVTKADILGQACAVLNRSTLSEEELLGVHQMIIEVDSHRGVSSRLYGFFNFVNIVWIVAIFGLLLSVGPVIYVLLKPLQGLLIVFVQDMILPFLSFCHRWGIFEALAYLTCWMFMVEGIRAPALTGHFLSLTGLGGLIPAYVYSTQLHASALEGSPDSEALVSQLLGLWLVLCFGPFAVHFQSKLFGYFTICFGYYALGFSFACYGLCYFIGFSSENALERCVVASAILLVLFTGLQIFNTKQYLLLPFSSAVSVLGSIVLFLGLLILSSRWYSHHHHTYLARQLFMAIPLILSQLVGGIYHLDGMRNTGTTFLVFYLLEKYTEMHFECDWNPWIFVFLVSAVMYWAALWLHRHPVFVKSMFESVNSSRLVGAAKERRQ
mmetsp:Transcript_27110/g.42731  ORF Transcript_27110/g.42731 Transcript_27110/m.42731 type:complete len:469 (-) Transcript_27110:105-1511(-)